MQSTLKKTDPPKRNGLRITSDNCYAAYDRKRVTIAPPIETKQVPPNHLGKYTYRYVLPDGTERIGDLKIDFPMIVGREVICKSGLKHKMDYSDEEKKKKAADKNYKMEGTPNGNYKAFCELVPTIPEHAKLQEILMDLYKMGIDWMRAYGTLGLGKLRKEYGNEVVGKNPDDWKTYFFDHLTPPVWFKDIDGEKEITPGRFVPVKVKDFNNPALTTLSINGPSHPFPTTFYEIKEENKIKEVDGKTVAYGEIDDEVIPLERLIGTGFRVVPIIEPILVVCPESLIKLNTSSAIVPEWIPLSAMEQLSTLEDMKTARIAGRTNVEVRSHLMDVLSRAGNDEKPPSKAVPKRGNQIDDKSDDDDGPPTAVRKPAFSMEDPQ